MLKLNDTTDFKDGNISFLDLSKKELEKSAACSEITDFLKTLSPIENRSYFHINMLGSSEIYGPTRNGDFFSSNTLRKYHKTFQTTPAKFFKHHQNKSHSPSFGMCIFATYNENMHRIELIVEADEPTSKEINELIAKGIYPKTSMACRLAYDSCSICGNIAKTRVEYCKHLMFEMGKLYPDGRRVYAINEDNITWFDASWVVRPADVTSSLLTKLAEDEHILGSAERAEIEGLTEKKATIRKWSELVKEISEEGEVLQHASTILEQTRDLPLHLTDVLANYDLNQSLTAMAVLGISPSISFLSELITKIHLGDGYEGIGPLVEEYIHSIPDNTAVPAINIETPLEPIDPILISILAPYVAGSSLLSYCVEKRASGVGYSHLGPHVEPTYEEEESALLAAQPKSKEFEVSYGKLLIGIGVSALLAKYFISSEIEKRLREERSLHVPQNYVKIGLMKRADYVVASSLSKATMNPYTLQKQRGDENGEIHGLSLARKLLNSTKTAVGGKLATMLKVVGLGQKIKETVTTSIQ
jgi:hypothetical protein